VSPSKTLAMVTLNVLYAVLVIMGKTDAQGFTHVIVMELAGIGILHAAATKG
jgi:hypothetical protein